MSSHESSTNELDRPPKRRIQRRHGACEPCRSSKTKCDGRSPCGACRSERRRQCPCVYSEKAMKLQQVTAEVRRRAEHERRRGHDPVGSHSDDELEPHSPNTSQKLPPRTTTTKDTSDTSMTGQEQDLTSSALEPDTVRMSQPMSVCATIEEFKRLKTARGYSAQVVSRCHGMQAIGSMTSDHQPKHHTALQSPTSFHRLSNCSQNLSQESTQVQVLSSRFDGIEDLVKEEQPQRAWVGLASIVREAQLIEASQDQSSSTSTGWRQLWSKILDFEALLGLTIGQPICLIPLQRSQPTSRNEQVLLEDSLEEIRMDLYQHVQGILGLSLVNDTAIRDFLERAWNVIHHEPFNQIGLCTTETHSAAVRDLHLNTHLLFMVTYCRMASLCDTFSQDLTNSSWLDTPAANIVRTLNLHQPRQKLTYCRKMFRSANFILESFISLHETITEETGRNWIRCHSAFIAATILGIAKLRHEVEWHATTDRLKRLEQIFASLSYLYPQRHLFTVAAARLQDLNSVKEPASEAQRNRHTGVKNRNKRRELNAGQIDLDESDHHNIDVLSQSASNPISPTSAASTNKRSRDMADEANTDSDANRDRGVSDRPFVDNGRQTLYEEVISGPLSLFQDLSAGWSASSTSLANTPRTSSATSFSESDMPVQAVAPVIPDHPGPPFALSFPYSVFHPPMAWNNPPYIMRDSVRVPSPLRMTVAPQRGSNMSAIAHGTGPQFGLPISTGAGPSPATSLQSSPLQMLSNGTTATERTSPSLPGSSGFHNPGVITAPSTEDTVRDQPFLEQFETIYLRNDLSDPSRRQFLASENPGQIAQPPSIIAQRFPQPGSGVWHDGPSVDLLHAMEPRPVSGSLSAPGLGQRASGDGTEQTGLRAPRFEHRPYYTHTTAEPSSDITVDQAYLPNQVSYLSSASGMFDQPQYHNHYTQVDAHQCPRYFI